MIAKKRQVDLTIERSFKGDELLMRMKGWVTTDVKNVIEVVKKHGYLKVLDERELVVEFDSEDNLKNLEMDFLNNFRDQVTLERI